MRRTGLHSASKLSVSQSLVSEIRYRLTPDIKKIRNLKHICKHIILIVFGFYLLLYCSSVWCLLSYMLIVPPTSRRCTLNRTYRERNSAVWCGTVQCTFSCSLLRRISPYNLFYYDKWWCNYTLSKTPEVGIWRIPAYAYIYPQYTPLTNRKFGGGLGKIWGACAPPDPSLKPPLHYVGASLG